MGGADELTGAPREIVPPDLRPSARRVPRATRWFGTSLATAVTIGGLVLWRLRPTAPIPPPVEPAPTVELVGRDALDEPAVPTIVDLAPPGETPPDWVAEGARLEAPVVAPVAPTRPSRAAEPLPALPSPEHVPCVAGCGSMAINTRPSSVVYVDGHLVGPTPQMSITLTPGEHLLTMENADRGLRESRRVTIVAGETLRQVITLIAEGDEDLPPPSPPPAPVELVLRSEPPGAVVSLVRRDLRRSLCTTPCTVVIERDRSDWHLVFERDGYALDDRPLALGGAATRTIERTLVPLGEVTPVVETPSRGELQRALGVAAIEAARCGTSEGRIAIVHVVFEGATGDGTATARGVASETTRACVEAAFDGVAVAPFVQERISIDYPVTL